MPDRHNERGWIRHVLGKNLTDEQISAAKIVHRRFHELDNDETLTPINPAASEYLTTQAVETLTPLKTGLLEISHANMPSAHKIHPETTQACC